MARGEPAIASPSHGGATVSRTPSLPRAAGFTFLGNFTYQFCLWAFFIALARLAGPESLGRFTVALTLCAPLALLTNLQLSALLGSDTQPTARLGAYLGARLLGMLTSLPLALLAALSISMDTTGLVLVLLIAGAKAVESFADLLRGALVAQQRFRATAVAQIVRGLLGLMAGSLGIWWCGSAEAAAIGLASGWLIGVIFADVPLVLRGYQSTHLWPRLWGEDVRQLLRLGLPLGLGSAALGLANYIPVYALEIWRDHHDVGRYAALMHVLMVGNLLATAFAVAAAPILGRHFTNGAFADGKRLIRRLVLGAALLALVAAALSWIAGDLFLRLAYGEDFAGLGIPLAEACLAAIPAWATSGLGVALTAARQVSAIPLVVGIGCVGGIAVAALLVPVHGLTGAIAASACASLIIFLLCLMLLHRTMRRPPDSIVRV